MMLDGLYLPPKPAIILPKPPELVRPGDPKFAMMPGIACGALVRTGGIGGNDANTMLLLHCDGANNGTTFTDSSSHARTVTVNGSAVTDTGTAKFGSASAKFGGGSNDWIGVSTCGVSGSGDFTIDFWINFLTSIPSQCALYSDVSNSEGTWDIEFLSASGVRVQLNGGSLHSFTWSPSANTWYHYAHVRASNVHNVYINGSALSGSFTNTDSLTDKGLQFGQRATGSEQFSGHMDEIRVSSIARWTSNFTPPAQAYG